MAGLDHWNWVPPPPRLEGLGDTNLLPHEASPRFKALKKSTNWVHQGTIHHGILTFGFNSLFGPLF